MLSLRNCCKVPITLQLPVLFQHICATKQSGIPAAKQLTCENFRGGSEPQETLPLHSTEFVKDQKCMLYTTLHNY